MAEAARGKGTMKAMVRRTYGGPEVLELAEVEKPEVTDDGVLVRVRASSINRGDWYGLTGKPLVTRPMIGLFKPKSELFGGDFAGTVEAVGKDVTDLEPGDEVFGGRSGAFAEYVNVRTGVTRKPANFTFEEAAAVPIGALTALQGLRDHGRVQAGQKVLVNGASGSVGIYAIQVAKALGTEVTAVCSTRNVDQAGELGADEVIDYTRDDFTRSRRRYDVLFDIAGNRSWRACTRALESHGTIVLVGGPKKNPLLGPLGHITRLKLASLLSSRKAAFFIAKFNRPDMDVLRELVESGQVRPVIERRYDLSQVPEALRYMGEGHVRSKIVVTI
jgi:NADPH:quinone reductase-like Zn-dependent oxidoreductase